MANKFLGHDKIKKELMHPSAHEMTKQLDYDTFLKKTKNQTYDIINLNKNLYYIYKLNYFLKYINSIIKYMVIYIYLNRVTISIISCIYQLLKLIGHFLKIIINKNFPTIFSNNNGKTNNGFCD